MTAPRELAATQTLLGGLLRQFQPLGEHEARAAIRELVAGNDRLSPEEQAEIYREQFWLRHRDSLYEDFPALAYLIGDDAFEALARAYLAAWPPRSWTLRDLGDKLADFAAGYDFPAEGAAARDLIRYELAFVPLFDAAAAAPVELAKVQAIAPDAWERARVVLQPAFVLLDLAHPVHAFRDAVKDGKQPERRIAPARTLLAMWQAADLRVHHRELEPGEMAVLAALREGLPLGAACARAADAAEAIERWFSAWARSGWVVDIQV